MPSFSSTLEAAIHNALGHANQRKHELATLEHLLLALLDEPEASRVMKACGVDIEKLRKTIVAFLDEELPDHWHGKTAVLGSRENVDYSHRFAGMLADRNWLIPHWPDEYGGSRATPWQLAILGEELWSRGEPRGPQYMNANWIGPSIMANGNDEQRQRYLPPIARGQVVSKIWEYIRANNLQNPENRREILADDKLKPVFGVDKVTMFEMNKHLSRHLSK